MPAPIARPPIVDIGFYAFNVRSQKDLDVVQTLVILHNDRLDTGSPLRRAYMFRFRGELFFCYLVRLLDGSGHCFMIDYLYLWQCLPVGQGEEGIKRTTAFLAAYLAHHRPALACIWPAQHPDGWVEERKESIEKEHFRAVVAQLPEETPDTPPVFSPQPPPNRTLGDGMEEIFTGAGVKFKPAFRPVRAPAEHGCYGCGTVTAKRCKACKFAFYCSKDCQIKDWYLHKKTCPLNVAVTPHWK